MKKFEVGDLIHKMDDLFEAAATTPVAITKHGQSRFVMMSMEQFEALKAGCVSQVALDVVDMPEEQGRLLDRGIEEHFRSGSADEHDIPKA